VSKKPNAIVEKLKQRNLPVGWTTFAMLVVAASFFVLGSRSDVLFANLTASHNKNLPTQLDYSQLTGLYSLLKSNYDGKLDATTLLDGAKKGMVEAAGDPYTTYFTDDEASQFLNDLDGKFSGIGAEIGKRDDNVTVISILDGSPAQKAGLMAGDIIGKVNDQDASSWQVDKVVATIRGAKGTTVKLLVVRGNDPREFTITRDDIVDPSVKSEVTNGIGYMRLSRFNETDTMNLAIKGAESFKSQNVKGVVLDLRGNGGGYVDVAQAVAGLWLDNSKVVVEERQGDKVIDTLKATGNPVLQGIPTVVLVDGGSASASEIVAGALRDHGVATLIGEKTFGKGSVQQVRAVQPGGGQLKVTVAKWYTPKGKNIDKSGIEPDQKTPYNRDELNKGNDAQKNKAIDFLKSK